MTLRRLTDQIGGLIDLTARNAACSIASATASASRAAGSRCCARAIARRLAALELVHHRHRQRQSRRCASSFPATCWRSPRSATPPRPRRSARWSRAGCAWSTASTSSRWRASVHGVLLAIAALEQAERATMIRPVSPTSGAPRPRHGSPPSCSTSATGCAGATRRSRTASSWV
ncbi:hypothetical protein AB5I41_19590 [Sphingomonas sp. MMS24-JH45]